MVIRIFRFLICFGFRISSFGFALVFCADLLRKSLYHPVSNVRLEDDVAGPLYLGARCFFGVTGAATHVPCWQAAALAIALGVAHPTVGTLGAAVAAAQVADIARGAARPVGAGEALAVVVGRASLPVAAMVGAVALARRAAAPPAGTGAVLAVGVGAADGRVRAFGAAGAAALVGGVARGATRGIDAGEVLAIGAARTALTVAAAVRAVSVTRGATAAVAGTHPALAVAAALQMPASGHLTPQAPPQRLGKSLGVQHVPLMQAAYLPQSASAAQRCPAAGAAGRPAADPTPPPLPRSRCCSVSLPWLATSSERVKNLHSCQRPCGNRRQRREAERPVRRRLRAAGGTCRHVRRTRSLSEVRGLGVRDLLSAGLRACEEIDILSPVAARANL